MINYILAEKCVGSIVKLHKKSTHVLCGGPLLRANCSAMVTELIRSGKVHTLTQNILWKLSVKLHLPL